MRDIIPVTFNNKDGHKLFGILHRAFGSAKRDSGIIILSPGVKSRVAPHRLYVKMAKRFTELGFDVLRFDFYGLGDSEGEINDKFNAEFYGSVQVGRYIDDTISAMDWMEKECRISRFILAGLCGGAITGLLAGARDKRVQSLLGLGIPVILDSINIDPAKYMTKAQLMDLRSAYFDKMLDFNAWKRLLLFKSDYKLLLKSLLVKMKKSPANKQAASITETAKGSSACSESNFNKHFPEAFHNMLSSRKVLLIFSGADRLYWEFEEKYISSYKKEFDHYKENLDIQIVEEANHIFSFQAWQSHMLDISCSWLDKLYANV